MFEKYAAVILDVSIDKALDYSIPQNLVDSIKKGVRVEVPVRGHLRPGYVVAIKDKPDFSPVKAIAKVTSSLELITEEIFELALWMARYYCTPLRQVLKILIPASIRTDMKPKQQLFVMRSKTKEEIQDHCIKIRNTFSAQAEVLDVMLQVTKGILLTELLEKTKGSRSPVDSLVKKGFLSIDIVRIDRSPLINEQYFQTKAKILNDEQNQAFIKITDSLNNNRFDTHLLFGITGSGKTEIYLQAIDCALKMGKGTIMLVPEIALTTQTIERFRSRFEGHIAILHHRLSPGERCDEWYRIRLGEAKIVIGARSALFSPVENLGLIIVDEEHENTYKQTDEMPCYHARDVAVMRGKMSNAPVILGSATPSLESYYNAQKGKYILSKLGVRPDSASLPTVTIVDMKHEFEKAKGFTNFSDALIDGIKKRIERGEQSILFLNRRGYHTTMMCQGCRKAIRCPHCDASLTFHLGENQLACHLCGYNARPPKNCPDCKHPDPLKFRGVGTELIEKSLHAILPNVRTIRMDADTTKHKGSHQKLFRAFGTGKGDVLIGTQMIAKGLHFPSVTLVGVLNSDGSLNLPDFRASETVFQLITQVSGRAGRGNIVGEVIIQTSLPENTTILHASRQDYETFYAEEIGVREAFQYPPFSQMAKVTFSGEDEKKTLQFAEQLRQKLLVLLPNTFQLHPVVPAGHAKVKDKYRFQFLLRGPNVAPMSRSIDTVLQTIKVPTDIKLRIDINPTSTFF
jgi:primosomal protein N' (replication factor Y)